VPGAPSAERPPWLRARAGCRGPPRLNGQLLRSLPGLSGGVTGRPNPQDGRGESSVGRLQEGEALMLQSYREASAKDNWLARKDATEGARLLAEFNASRGRVCEAARYRALAEAAQR
jgi:hypothetical protein